MERIKGSIEGGRAVVLRGHVAREIAGATDRGPLAPETRLSGVRLILKPSAAQAADLEQLLEDQRNPASPDYQNWLTPEQFADRFGVSENDIGKATAWLQGQGFSVEQVARARNFIVFNGTASQLAQTFRVEMRGYELEGKRHFATPSEPSVPAALAGVVEEIRGLHDFHPKPSAARRLRPGYTSGSTHYLSPDDLATIYDVMPLYKAGFDGTGQKLVIPGQTDINIADIRAFRSQFGLPSKDPQLVLDGTDPGVSQGDQVESELDIEWAGAVARNATIVFVYSQDVFTSIQYAIDQNLAPVISLSYGGCELGVSASYRNMALQANAEGITWMTASGDSGAAGCDAQGIAKATYGPAVSFPANIPEVTAVGGTEFNESGTTGWSSTNSSTWLSATGYIPEKAWNDSAAANGAEGSGGGASVVYAKPWWQTGAGVPNDNARDVPDVALSASGAHDGYIIYYGGGLMSVGGTSASSPSFAGMIALLNQYLVTKGVQAKPGVGNINPKLYSLAQSTPAAFHDVTVGDNIVSCKAGSTGCPSSGSFGYKAGVGYDQVTGLGSVDANVLVTNWASLPAGVGTTTTVTASPTSVTSTGSTTLTAKVAAVSGTTVPTGSVTFSLGSTSLGSVTVSAGVATLAVKGSSLATGANSIAAAFTASGNFSNSSGTVTVTVTSTAIATTTTVAANPASIATTATTQVTVTVKAASGTAAPTGSVTLSSGSVSLGTSTLSATGIATFSIPGTNLIVGTNTLTATYTASGTFSNSSGTASVTVTSPVVATTTLVAASPSSFANTASTQVTVTIKAATGTTTPTGSVTLSSGQTSSGQTSLGTAAVSSSGIVAFTVKGASLPIGASTLTAAFTASGNFGNSSGTATVTVTSTAVATTTTVSASPANFASTATTQVTVTVRAASGTAVPAGTVTLNAGAASLGSASLSSTGVATLSVKGSTLNVGANTLTASFAGSTAFSASSGTTSVTVTSTAIPTTTSVSASPSTIASTATTQVTVSVKAATGATAPTGSVALTLGSTSLGSAAVTATGTATFSVKGTSLATGANTLTASFTPSGNFSNSTGTATVTVTAAGTATATSLVATPATFATSGSTQLLVTVKAQSGTAIPTGTVTLTSGATTLGSATLSPTGTATFSAKGTSLATGANTLTATFTGWGNFANSTGTTNVTVTAPASAANVVLTATQKTSTQPGWPVAIQLQETAGVATKITGFAIAGTDFSSIITGAFGSNQLPAGGALNAFLIIQWKPLPASITFTVSGTDANNHAWTQTTTVKTSGN